VRLMPATRNRLNISPGRRVLAQIKFGPRAIGSFRRLSYTPWHALAEFVDNSTQSYFNNREVLDADFASEGTKLTVSITYDQATGELRVTDNAMGMSMAELARALDIGSPPAQVGGRSQYGFGLKTAASWFGDVWSVESRRRGDPTGHHMTIDVNRVANGDSNVDINPIPADDPRGSHFTTVIVKQVNRRLRGRTHAKIKEFLRSMYREDLRRGTLSLSWMNEHLHWGDEFPLLKRTDGTPWRVDFSLTVLGKDVNGWAGILERGGRKKAGFSIMHAGRVIKGPPDPWRPESIFGQIQGSNDLVNQRLVGEVILDDFAVSHTKDDIVWGTDEEEGVERALKEELAGIREAAQAFRQRPLNPSSSDVRAAVSLLQAKIVSTGISSEWLHLALPAIDQRHQARDDVIEGLTSQAPDFTTSINGLTVSGFVRNLAVTDECVTVSDGHDASDLSIVLNLSHPFVTGMKRPELLSHFEHCAFQALAEWRGIRETQHAGDDVLDATAYFKDALLRAAAAPPETDR
jgi:Histidine kinase-, DNA gyrase B-, and HSP90-like ATPase